MLERARSEVAALASRRQDITTQLGHLSGVIDALSVPERPTRTAADDDPPTRTPPTHRPSDPDPAPHQERTDHE